MDKAEWKLLKEIADLEQTPQGAYNIRRNGQLESRSSTANIEITTKTESGKPGIDIHIKPGTKHESVHIPVIVTETGLKDLVYNDFFIGADCDVDIIAGCGIHNCGVDTSKHDGIHSFFVGKNCRVRYVEKHYGEGDGSGPALIAKLKNEGPTRELMAALQRFSVNIPVELFNDIFKMGGIEDIHGYYALDSAFYRPGEGVVTDSHFNYDKDNFIY